MLAAAQCIVMGPVCRDVNKAGSFKGKARARSLKAKTKAKAKVEFNSYGL